MKAEDLREMSRAELGEKLEDLRKELFNLRFRVTMGELDNVMQIRLTRKNIARVLTVMRQKELAGEPLDDSSVVTRRQAAGRRARK